MTEHNRDLPDLIRELDTGARQPKGLPGIIMLTAALSWAFFQVWYASPLPFMFNAFVFNETEARAIHLAFALFLGFLAYPATRHSSRRIISPYDWTLALLAAFCGSYLFWFYAELADRPGLPSYLDIFAGATGVLLLLEAARRCLGMPLMMMAIVALIYSLWGAYMPDIVAHKGASIVKNVGHQWLSTEGVFGIALGVSTGFVFLFVLFGALLDKVGAGNFFIQLAFSLLGHYRGGPAKAGVVASGLTGLISGSSVANVVTTGTFTIPLMKKVGFPSEKAGALEAATGINGQIMPPVMGAAAFLMVEYVGISYEDVCKHAFLPAIISYIALMYTVHLEAVSSNMRILKQEQPTALRQRLTNLLLTVSGLLTFMGIVYYGVSFIKSVAGAYSMPLILSLLLAAYVVLIRLSSRYPDLDPDLLDKEITVTPPAGPIFKSGTYFLLPVLILVWCLMVERLSPGISAFWATMFLMFVIMTRDTLVSYFRGEPCKLKQQLNKAFHNIVDGFADGSRNMICIGIATATAGIIVGTVSLTGIGLKMTVLVEQLSGGNILMVLCITALLSLVLGMGLPTTANYIVVSTLMAPVLVDLAAESGLIIPLIAVHLFVFYFGIMADVTPPVGLASFAAAAISGSDPIRTGFRAFFYSLRTVALPFIFVYNTQILLIGINSPLDMILTIASAVLGMLIFSASLKGFFLVKNRLYETALLLLVTFTLFRPGYWMDTFQPPFEEHKPTEILDLLETIPNNGSLQMTVAGEDLTGKKTRKAVLVPVGPTAPSAERLRYAGLKLRFDGDEVIIDQVSFGKPADKAGIDFDWRIIHIHLPADRLSPKLFFIPALLVLWLVVMAQRRRRRILDEKGTNSVS
jgi:TRAP transporter 4TM/12TM fusion protein